MDRRGVSRRVPRSELICPKDFLQSWDVDVLEVAQMKQPSTESQIFQNIATKMGITEETVKELAEVCGKNTLYSGNEPHNKVAMLQLKEAPPEVDLECVKYQLEHRKQRQENDSLKILVNRNMKYNSLDDYLAVVVPSAPRTNIDQECMVKQPNVVLTVQITKCLMQGEISQMIREKETFLVLGSQKLTELRDKIQCSSDTVIPGDYSCMPDVDPEKLQQAGDIFKSGFFFIENVFYNDMRLPDNKDYSESIIRWTAECKPDVVMKKADMAKTTFFDLNLRLGHHYLFMHQGNCEHSVLFTDMRLFNASDCQDIRTYPLSYIRRTKNRIVCQGCCKLSARWIVRDSPLIPTDPCYLCRLCFKTLLYTKQGQKTSNFKAQHFLDALNQTSSPIM